MLEIKGLISQCNITLKSGGLIEILTTTWPLLYRLEICFVSTCFERKKTSVWPLELLSDLGLFTDFPKSCMNSHAHLAHTHADSFDRCVSSWSLLQ